jgi:hypothetical protein
MVVATFVVATLATGGWAHADAPRTPWKAEVAPGLTIEREVRHRPDLVVHVARVAPGAHFSLRPVLAHDRVGDPTLDREPVSDMCRRAGGIVCVNADFAACPTCRAPYGGVMVDDRVLRSFNPAHGQVSQVQGHLTSDMLAWGGTVSASYASWRELPGVLGQPPRRVDERTQRDDLPIAGVNIDPVADGIVLYTPDWGGATPGAAVQVTIATPRPVAPGSLPAEIVGRRGGAGPLGNDSVLAGNGRAADQLAAFADHWRTSDANEKHLVLVTAVSQPASFSVGGHPVLLRRGVRQDWDRRNDPKAIGRHPRTLLGWNGSGEILLVTVDGREHGVSDGLTLDEAADLLRSLGATEGINLDGGGSTTFVGPCPSGPCVLNRPSAGRERLVPIALALVGDRRGLHPVPQATGTALLPPAPPTGEDDAASTPHGTVPPVEVAPVTPGAPAAGSDVASAADGGDAPTGTFDALGASRLFGAGPRRQSSASRAPSRRRPGHSPLPATVLAMAAAVAGLSGRPRRRRSRASAE